MSPKPTRPTIEAEARRLGRLAARIETLERDVLPRAQAFEDRLASLEEYARETSNERMIADLADIRRAAKAEADPKRTTDADTMALAMGRGRMQLGTQRTRNGIVLGVPVASSGEGVPMPTPRKAPADPRPAKERDADRAVMRRALGVDVSSSGTRGTARSADQQAMAIAMGRSVVRDDGVRFNRDGSVSLGVSHVPNDKE